MMLDDDGVFTLVLVRHADAGTPEAFARHRPGRPDAERPLTAEGRQQARDLAATLESIGPRPGLILSSSWRRALQTAEPLARRAGLDVETGVVVAEHRLDRGANAASAVSEPALPWNPPLDPTQLRRYLIAAVQHRGLCCRGGQPIEPRLRSGVFLFGHEPDFSRLVAAWLGVEACHGSVARFDRATFCQMSVPCTTAETETGDRPGVWPGAELLALWPLGYGQALLEHG